MCTLTPCEWMHYTFLITFVLLSLSLSVSFFFCFFLSLACTWVSSVHMRTTFFSVNGLNSVTWDWWLGKVFLCNGTIKSQWKMLSSLLVSRCMLPSVSERWEGCSSSSAHPASLSLSLSLCFSRSAFLFFLLLHSYFLLYSVCDARACSLLMQLLMLQAGRVQREGHLQVLMRAEDNEEDEKKNKETK